MMHSPSLLVVCLSSLLLLSACGQKNEQEYAAASAASAMPPSFEAMASAPAPIAAPVSEAANTEQQMTSTAVTFNDANRKFVRTGSAKFEVKDVYQSALVIENLVAAHGGFVTQSHIGTEDISRREVKQSGQTLVRVVEYNVSGQMVVRVPSIRTQEFLRALAGQIVFLQERHFEARDVQFELLHQHLNASRAQQTQQDLAAAVAAGGKLADKADVINQREMSKSGQDYALVAQKEIEDQVAFSTLNLSLYQQPKLRHSTLADIDATLKTYDPSYGAQILAGIRSGWNGLLGFILFLVEIWPLTVGLILVISAIRYFRKARKQME